MKNLFLFLTFLFFTANAAAETVRLTTGRIVSIKGTVNSSAIDWADQIEKLAAQDSFLREPIDIVITSGGGSVALGSQVLSAIEIAQGRGYTVRCFVPVLAASMGFQILAACDERYALKYALLLWHPMKVGFQNSVGSDELLYHAKRLQDWEIPFVKYLLSKLKIDMKTFEYHRREETLWMAYEFPGLSKDFLKVVDDMQNVQGLFSIGD